jgi:hypothetical protein
MQDPNTERRIMSKKDPYTLEGTLAELGELKTVQDFDDAGQKMAAKLDALRGHIKELEYRRAQALSALDGAGVTGIDLRLEQLRKVLPDLEAAARILYQRGQDVRIAEAAKAAPSLLRKLEPLAAKLQEIRNAEGAALRALLAAAEACRGAWSSISQSDLPPRTKADDALVARVDELLGGGSTGRTKFELPRPPRDPGEVTTVTMTRPEKTFDVSRERLRGGVG